MSFDKKTSFVAIAGDPMVADLINNHVANNGKSFTGVEAERGAHGLANAQKAEISGPHL